MLGFPNMRSAPARIHEGKELGFRVIDKYMEEVNRIPLFTREQEEKLFRDIDELELIKYNAVMEDLQFRCRILSDLHRRIDDSDCEDASDMLIALSGVNDRLFARCDLETFVRSIKWTEVGRDWAIKVESEVGAIKQQKESSWVLSFLKASDDIRKLKDKFINANLRLVISVIRTQMGKRRDSNITDLIQEGNIGLMKAVDKFDVSRGNRFSTYACWWIRHHVSRFIEDRDCVIRVPINIQAATKRIRKIQSQNVSKTGRELSEHELMKRTGYTSKKVSSANDPLIRWVSSLDEPYGDDNTIGSNIEDFETPSPHEVLSHVRTREKFDKVLGELRKFEADVIRWRFGFDGHGEQTLQEIASKHNLSRERVRQVEFEALRKLKKVMISQEWL